MTPVHRLSWSCARWAVAALVVGVLAEVSIAWAQDTPEAAAVLDPTSVLLIEMVKGGGLPAALAAAAWWARGVIGAGIPVVVQLSEADRTLLARARVTFEERTDPGVRRNDPVVPR